MHFGDQAPNPIHRNVLTTMIPNGGQTPNGNEPRRLCNEKMQWTCAVKDCSCSFLFLQLQFLHCICSNVQFHKCFLMFPQNCSCSFLENCSCICSLHKCMLQPAGALPVSICPWGTMYNNDASTYWSVGDGIQKIIPYPPEPKAPKKLTEKVSFRPRKRTT